jgi:hypothetical protein
VDPSDIQMIQMIAGDDEHYDGCCEEFGQAGKLTREEFEEGQYMRMVHVTMGDDDMGGEQRPVSAELKLYGRSRKTINPDGTERSLQVKWDRVNSCWPNSEDRDADGHLCLRDNPDDKEIEREDCFLVGSSGVISGVKVSSKCQQIW